jgi:hypothetical protein
VNSQQRRKHRREWRYRVDLGSRPYDDYLDMWDWLDQRHGRKILRCGWRIKAEYNNDTDDEYFLTCIFLRARDAAEFALRWS